MPQWRRPSIHIGDPGQAGVIQVGSSSDPASEEETMASVQVVLATHNGARYLSEQLDSLFRQTSQDFTIVAADDNSTDGTPQILEQYRHRHPDRIDILDFTGEAVGACGNFARLAEHLSAGYAMFCDQDDVWLPNKVALSLERIRFLEAQYTKATPLLVHTDLTVVGRDLERRHQSYWRYAKIQPRGVSFNQLLLRFTVAGCTTIVNRALYAKATPIPKAAIMHDGWIALVAAAFGKIDCISESTILYRRHGSNVSGSWAPGLLHSFRVMIDAFRGRGEAAQRLDAHVLQARAFLARFDRDLNFDHRVALNALVDVFALRPRLRFFKLLRSGVVRRGLLENARLGIAVTFHRSTAH
jgi:glycosyltransferase involved in cell wall biosynthesis